MALEQTLREVRRINRQTEIIIPWLFFAAGIPAGMLLAVVLYG